MVNIVDAIIFFVILFSLYRGYQKGLWNVLIGFGGLFFGFLLAMVLALPLSRFIAKIIKISQSTTIIISFLGIIVVAFAISIIIKSLLKRFSTRKSLPVWDTMGGMVAGLLRGVTLSAILLVFLAMLNDAGLNRQVYNKSASGKLFFNRFPIGATVKGSIIKKAGTKKRRIHESESVLKAFEGKEKKDNKEYPKQP